MSAEAPEMTAEKIFFSAAYDSLPGGYPEENPIPEQAALMYIATRIAGFDMASIYFDDFAESELGHMFKSLALNPAEDNKRFPDEDLITIIDGMEFLDSNLKLALIPVVKRTTRRARLFTDVFINEPEGEVKNKAYEMLLDDAQTTVDNMRPTFERLNQKHFVANIHRAYRYIQETVVDEEARKELGEPLGRLLNRVEALFPNIIGDAIIDLRGGSKGDFMTPNGKRSGVKLMPVTTITLGSNGQEMLG